MEEFKIDILGSKWTIKYGTKDEFPNLVDSDGYTDSSVKEIIIDNMSIIAQDVTSKKNIGAYQAQVIRHEIIHAFLAESGLEGNGFMVEHWELNEEMIDWFAIQSPKIYKVFAELNIL